GGANDLATTDFPVTVGKYEFASASHYRPENKAHEAMPYSLLEFRANQKIKDLDGAYKTELFLNGEKVLERPEPTIMYTPEFLKDEGKTLELKTYFKSTVMKDYVMIDDQTWKIKPPPLLAFKGGDIEVGDDFDIVAMLGIPGDTKEIGSD